MRTSHRLLALAGLAAGFSCLHLSRVVADDRVSSDPVRGSTVSLAGDGQIESLKQLLKREAAGEAVDRSQVVQQQPQTEWAAWQAGLVKVNQGWQAADRLDDVNSDQAYQKKRDEVGNDPNSQVKLARWCRENHREELARAHYFAVLAEDPNHAESRKYLGHVQVGGEWVDSQELKARREAVRKEVLAFEHVSAKLRPILENLTSSNSATVAAALDRLDALDGESALPAIVWACSKVEDDLAQPFVRKIAQTKSQAACTALVRLACSHPSSKIQQLAVKNIKSYPLDMYVPTLLGQLAGDVSVENQMVLQPNGNVSMETIIKQELKDKHLQQSFQKSVNALSTFFTRRDIKQITGNVVDEYEWSIARGIPKENPRHIGERLYGTSGTAATAVGQATYVPVEIAQSVSDTLQEQGQAKKLEAERFNRVQAERAAPIYTLLRNVTGQELDDSPKQWWDWWTETNERYVGLKPVQKSYAYSREKLSLDSRNYQNNVVFGSVRYLGKTLVQHSCLIAGTPVQTSTGLQPIDTIKVGDRVLCQDQDSGELSLQPVLLTTVRPPRSTIKIVTTGATIQATGGHLWWVSDKGWQKTRDLLPGLYLHTASGNVQVKELITVEEPAPTYNLVVDRHHTYFVGPDRVLSYDNTPLKATLLPLPGYVEQ